MNKAMLLTGMCAMLAGVALVAAQTIPATDMAPQTARGRAAGGGEGRGGRGPATGPGMVQDQVTSQWYTPQRHVDYAFGADVSSLPQQQPRTQYKDDGVVKPALQILRDHGFNYIRARVCTVGPRSLPQTTAYTVALAKDARKLGFKFLLDFHYSDSWADPRNEPIPSAWQNLTQPELVQATFEYTRDTIAAFAKEDVLPDIIQVGNEVSNGFMMPNAKLPDHWNEFAELIYAGVNGIDAGRGNGKRPRIMIHVDHGGDVPKTKAFFDKLATYEVPFDMIGFSFYPWSHGNLLDLKENLEFAAKTYQKDVMVVETGYQHATSNYFRTTPGPFPETPEGQAQFMAAVNDIIMHVPEGRGKGIFYWEPTDQNLERGGRSFFDATGNALPVVSVFQQYTRPIHRTDNQ